jgi:hypothetical protein
MTVQEFVNIDKDLQTVQDISDVNIIILIYLFIKPCIIYTYVFVQVQNACQSSWKFIFSYDHLTSGFQCPSVYRQTTDCTEGGSLTRERCISLIYDNGS